MSADVFCLRAECEHLAQDHNDDGCRRTGCPCAELLLPEVKQVAQGRKVCVDVPDGYMLTVSLVPYSQADSSETKP